MQRKFNTAALAIVISVFACPLALARGNDVVITDGMGEQVTVKHGFFGRNTKVVKDRFGDGFAEKTGLLGTKEKDVNILGNGFRSKTGILGGTDLKGSTIFGDKVETKKGIFGRRTTYVDASGTANMVRGLWNQHKDEILGNSSSKLPATLPGTQSMPDLNAPMP